MRHKRREDTTVHPRLNERLLAVAAQRRTEADRAEILRQLEKLVSHFGRLTDIPAFAGPAKQVVSRYRDLHRRISTGHVDVKDINFIVDQTTIELTVLLQTISSGLLL